jgi:hypothetical protein
MSRLSAGAIASYSSGPIETMACTATNAWENISVIEAIWTASNHSAFRFNGSTDRNSHADKVRCQICGRIPDLSRRLDVYSANKHLAGVRQHLGWDQNHPLRRMASRSDFLIDPIWLKGLATLKGRKSAVRVRSLLPWHRNCTRASHHYTKARHTDP